MFKHSLIKMFFHSFLPLVLLVLSFPASAVEKIILQLRWDNQFQFAGFYAAKWMGYYTAAGLDVEIKSALEPGGKILKAIKEVSENRATFGIGGADILIGNDKGPALTVSATLFQRSGVAFFYRATTKIRSPKDLLDKKISRNTNDLTDVEFQAMLRINHISPDKIHSYPYRAGIELLLSGEADVIPGYIINIPFAAKLMGEEIKYLAPISYGIDFYGDSLFSTTKYAEDNPSQVQHFIEASLLGWKYAMAHKEEIAERITKELPREEKVNDLLAFNLFQSRALDEMFESDYVELGHTNPARWQRMHSYLKESGLISKELDIQKFVFNKRHIENDKYATQIRILMLVLVILIVVVFFASFFIILLKNMVKKRTKELSSNEKKLRTVLDIMPVGVFLTDKSGKIVYTNPAAIDIWQGIPFVEAEHIQVCKGWWRINNKPLLPEEWGIFRAIKTLEESHEEEIEIECLGGSRKIILNWAKPILDENGTFEGALAINQDITTRIRSAEELKNAAEQAKKADIAKSNFLANMSHELRTPMNGIMGIAQLYDITLKDPTDRQYLQILRNSSENMLTLIEDLLDLSRLSTANIMLESIKISPIDLAREAISLLRAQATTKGIVISFSAAENVPEYIFGDPLRIQQILLNLLSNSIKFTDKGSINIDISASIIQGTTEVIFRVSDTGVGIGKDVLPHIFERFVQGDMGYRKKFQGAGLGLSICKELAALMNGDIHVESELGKGSVFTVKIPFKAVCC